MKITNETKVGILAIVAVALLILGFNFLKGKSIFNKKTQIYAVFDNLSGLDKSNQVKINGLPVGTVYDLDEMDKKVTGIIVTINLSRDVDIPKNSVAHITSGIVGASYIDIDVGNSTKYMEDGDTLNTRVDVGLLGDLSSQVSPTLGKARDAIDSLTMLLGNFNSLLDPATKRNLQITMYNLAQSSAGLQRLINAESGLLAQSLSNVNAVTGNLARNNEKITNTLSNLEQTSSKFAALDIQSTLTKLDLTVSKLNETINAMNSTTGTLGALLHDKTLYENLNFAVIGLETLLDDIRVHPKRYVNISLIGGKDKGAPITSPTLKDTVRRK